MQILTKDNYKELFIFKFFVFLWIMSIPFKNAVFQFSIFSIIIFFIYHLAKTKNFSLLFENLNKTKYLAIGFSFIILSLCISNFLNPEYLANNSWHKTFMFVIRYGLIFIILAYFYKLDFFTIKEITIACVFSFLFLLSTGLYQVIIDPNVIKGIGITGTLDNRNAFGLMMGMGFVLSISLLKYNKNLALFLIFTFSFFMLFSFSRSSWVASSCATIILIAINYKELRFKHLLYFLIFVLFLITIYFSFDSIQIRFTQLLERDSSSRTTIWIHTIEFIKEKLLFGYGLNSFAKLPNSYLNQFPDPHNSVLEILLYTGLFGLISALFTIGVVIYKIIKTKNLNLLPIATYFVVVTQFDFGAYGSKELLSFLTIFVFFVYADSFQRKD